MTHLSCTPCRQRFDARRMPDLETCPDCDGALEPLAPADALGLSLYRAPRGTDAPVWTDVLAVALQRLPPAP